MSQEMVPTTPALDLSIPIDFVDLTGKGDPKDTLMNTMIALNKLDLDFRFDQFREYYLLNDDELTDAFCRQLRLVIRQNFRFDPGEANMITAAKAACERRGFHPLKDYLNSLKWDGVPRIDKFFSDYMNAADNEYARAVAHITFVASVRRIFIPNVKFDYLPVLQGIEGLNKSTALRVLYGDEFFTDVSILGADSKHTEEIGRGMWCVECAEVAGLKKTDQENVKSQLSRQKERARRPYDRLSKNFPRTFITWGTTNESQFLRASWGENRRFLPITVGRIDINRIVADRDQLWAEAKFYADNELGDCALPEHLWREAYNERQPFTLSDPWDDTLCEISTNAARDQSEDYSDKDIYQRVAGLSDGEVEERVASSYVLDRLDIPTERRTAEIGRRAGVVMRGLGWDGPKTIRINQTRMKGYTRNEPQPWD